MSEWYDSQKNTNGDFRKLLQERIEKANPRHELTAEEARRMAKEKSLVLLQKMSF